MINENYQLILEHVFSLKSAGKDIIGKMKSEDLGTKTDAVKFLLELSNAAKIQLSETKSSFFTSLLEEDLLGALTELLTLGEEDVRASTAKEEKKESVFKSPDLSREFYETHTTGKVELLQVWTGEILTNMLQLLPSKRVERTYNSKA